MTHSTPVTANFAVIFPGQGSQSVDMLADWASHYPSILQTFTQASHAIGVDLWAICQGKSEHHLDDTAYTQPALLTASMAIWQVLQAEFKQPPRFLAGHSLGEYTALCAAGVLSLEDTVALVHERGKLMTQAISQDLKQHTGKMAAVLGLADEVVTRLCTEIVAENHEAIVSPANFNSPGQVVIAGNALGVNAVMVKVSEMGNKSMPLKVSVPSHCGLMQPAADALAERLTQIEFHTPRLPVIQNRHARVETDTTAIKQALIEQLSMPVLWSQTEDFLASQGVTLQIECGSGSVLTNLAKRQTQKIPTFATDKVEKLAAVIAALASDTAQELTQ